MLPDPPFVVTTEVLKELGEFHDTLADALGVDISESDRRAFCPSLVPVSYGKTHFSIGLQLVETGLRKFDYFEINGVQFAVCKNILPHLEGNRLIYTTRGIQLAKNV